MESYAKDFEFVFSAISQLDPVEALKRPFPEVFVSLPHPSGVGFMLCGMDAHRRLRDMAERALARSPYVGTVETEAVFRELKEITVQRFLIFHAISVMPTGQTPLPSGQSVSNNGG